MTILLSPELEAAVKQLAARQGVSPERLVATALQERFLVPGAIAPQDEWERQLLQAATPCGVSLSHLAVSSEALYD